MRAIDKNLKDILLEEKSYIKNENILIHDISYKTLMSSMPLRIVVWGQLSFGSHKMLEANTVHIWKLQTKTNHFQHVSIFYSHFVHFKEHMKMTTKNRFSLITQILKLGECSYYTHLQRII